VTVARVEIVPLADVPDLIPVVARWHWNEWGAGDPTGSLGWVDRWAAPSLGPRPYPDKLGSFRSDPHSAFKKLLTPAPSARTLAMRTRLRSAPLRRGVGRVEKKVRQAVVMIHGMGEQRPLETLNEFIRVGLQPGADGTRHYYSRPDSVTDSYEARRYLAPRAVESGVEVHAQTEFFEYHWAHLMQGNKLTDLWPTFRRLLLQWPTRVPSGLRGLWVVMWIAIALAAWAFSIGPWSHLQIANFRVTGIAGAILGGGVVALLATFLVADVIPGWLTSSFVDVVRYLDTSPRSYAVRHDIRKGIIDLLQGLHDADRYQRIVIVGHSLGSYIAYDAISYLWGQLGAEHRGPPLIPNKEGEQPDGLRQLEASASALVANAGSVTAYQDAQRTLWLGLRQVGNPWLITDFISFGSPMYFADELVTRSRAQFEERREKRELPTCPPRSEPAAYNNVNQQPVWLSWKNRGRRMLYYAAPFGVVRWTNLWFPTRLGLFGDWFGGSLATLFGRGIREIELTHNGWRSRIPGYAHALYLHFLTDERPESVTTQLRVALDLASSRWLAATLDAPRPDSATQHGSA
jgi:hypothetical protein